MTSSLLFVLFTRSHSHMCSLRVAYRGSVKGCNFPLCVPNSWFFLAGRALYSMRALNVAKVNFNPPIMRCQRMCVLCVVCLPGMSP